MNYKKAILTLLLSTPIYFGFISVADAETVKENVSVFYTNDEGKKMILQKADEVEVQLNNIDAVVGSFSQADIKAMEASKNIKVVHTGNKKLRVNTSTLPVLSYANFTTNWNQNLVQSSYAWQYGLDGKNIRVGIIDAGVATHSNLSTVHRKDFASVPNTSTGATKHGTFVAGIIAAKPLLNGMMFGVAPGVNLYSMNVDGQDGGELSDIISAIDYAIAQKLQIVNISMGISKVDLLDEGEKLTDNPLYLAVKKAQKAGVLFVAATGNNGVAIDYPAAFSDVVGVGAITSSKNIARFSNKGQEVDLVAPGDSVQSLNYNGGFRIDSGTSFSTPHVTGLLALLKQQYPNDTNEQLVTRLISNSEDLGAKGFDTTYGHGLAKYAKQVVSEPVTVPEDTKTDNVPPPSTNEPELTIPEETPPAQAEPEKPTTTPVKKETAAQKYIRLNQKKIKTITQKIVAHKKLNYLTEYTPLYSVYSNLTKTQKIALVSYRKDIIPSIISGSIKSTRISATNINSLKTKKTSKITFNTTFKTSTIQSNAFAMYKDGVKVNNFKVTKAKNGKSITIKTTKALSKGTYHFAIDTTKFRTTKNKAVRPYMVTYVVK